MREVPCGASNGAAVDSFVDEPFTDSSVRAELARPTRQMHHRIDVQKAPECDRLVGIERQEEGNG